PKFTAGWLLLLEIYGRACLGELLLDPLGLVLRDALLDRLRRPLDQVFGFLEPERGNLTNNLDDPDLLPWISHSRQNYIEFLFLFCCGCCGSGPGSGCCRDCSGCG